MFKKHVRLALTLLALIILTPAGIMASGTAFGEWTAEELGQKAGYIPVGLARMDTLWKHALFPEYSMSGLNGSYAQSALGYIVCALLGAGLIIGIMWFLTKIVKE